MGASPDTLSQAGRLYTSIGDVWLRPSLWFVLCCLLFCTLVVMHSNFFGTTFSGSLLASILHWVGAVSWVSSPEPIITYLCSRPPTGQMHLLASSLSYRRTQKLSVNTSKIWPCGVSAHLPSLFIWLSVGKRQAFWVTAIVHSSVAWHQVARTCCYISLTAIADILFVSGFLVCHLTKLNRNRFIAVSLCGVRTLFKALQAPPVFMWCCIFPGQNKSIIILPLLLLCGTLSLCL